MAKRRLIGTITSAKMHETAIVTVMRYKRHPLYGKRYRVTKTFAAHNPSNLHKEGEQVAIEETRPISKSKHWIIREQVAKAQTALIETSDAAEISAS